MTALDHLTIVAIFGLLTGALYATEVDDAPTDMGIQIIHIEPDGCQSVRTDGGWAPRLRRDGSRFCGSSK